MYQAVGALYAHLIIHPRPQRLRGIVRIKNIEFTAAAHDRLQHIIGFPHPGKLIPFLEPDITKIAERDFYGLDFHRIVKTSKHNRLPARQICDFHRTDRRFKILRHAQFINSPQHLCKNAVPQRVCNFAEHDRVRVRVFNDAADNFKRYIAALRASAPAFKHIVRMLPSTHIAMHLIKRRRDYVSKPDGHVSRPLYRR